MRRRWRGRRQAYGSVSFPGAEGIPAGEPITEVPAALLGAPAFPDTHPPSAAPPPRSFDDWWAEGQARGWVSDPFCAAHHVEPMTEVERAAWTEGFDICTRGCVRVWPLAGDGRPG